MDQPEHQRQTRIAYDIVAQDYAAMLRDELADKPIERAMLAAYAELVETAQLGAVLEVGCGPGRIAAHLHTLGLDTSGVDLSEAMVVEARRAYPELSFEQGTMQHLRTADSTLGGVVAWYSIIHTPPAEHGEIFAEFYRVLRPGGYVLLAFQVGNAPVHIEHAYGHDIDAEAYRLDPTQVVADLERAGFAPHSRVVREREEPEKTPQAYLIAVKPTVS